MSPYLCASSAQQRILQYGRAQATAYIDCKLHSVPEETVYPRIHLILI